MKLADSSATLLSRFSTRARMRVPLIWESCCIDGANMKCSRQKLSDYAPLGTAISFFSCFTIFIFFLLFCVLNSGYNNIDNRCTLLDSNPVLASPRRVLQSSSVGEVVEARRPLGALGGLGFTFRVGTRAVNEVIVAHLSEVTTTEELRLFLRTLHRSGATAKADVVLLFPGALTEEIKLVVDEEETSFLRLMLERQASAPPHEHRSKSSRYPKETDESARRSAAEDLKNSNAGQMVAAPETRQFQTSKSAINPFNSKAFWKSKDERRGQEEIMWERRSDQSNASGLMATINWGDWGSIVGFEMQDLDQDEVFAGLIDDSPMELRRWVCYHMLLGMVKSKYRNVVLAEVGGVYILRDVLSPTRKRSFESEINLYEEDRSWNDVYIASHTMATGEFTKRVELDAPSVMAADGLKDRPGHPDGEKVEVSSKTSPNRQEVHQTFVEEVYGKDTWTSLGNGDKDKSVLGSRFIIGSMRAARSLANAMVTEIAAVAIKRKSRQPFQDLAVLNHLLRKSSSLSKRVTAKLRTLKSRESPVHSLSGSKQPNLFFKEDGSGFAAIVGQASEEVVYKQRVTHIGRIIWDEICSSQADSIIYEDCIEDHVR